ncbi:hypothetical protein Isop_2334 [Isosphaera pallida ATCC 43644]|jgi:hypothetical protein|uniref:Uncharacterized protein n=1 Tax=Isosphaera pallida (strain ATCC 43644 / DSM 9630 / IS1B) TaxID=575540 RepID=E8R6K1_ISOPI|nr:hypothetical protein [Isosphaera pallida]ADV62912.1 hypothetical protein Isop_2334 [Isosphaera pallida ATCC 43644]
MIWQPRVGQRVRLRYGLTRALARARRHAARGRRRDAALEERVRRLFPHQDRIGTVVAFGNRGRGPRNVLVRLEMVIAPDATGVDVAGKGQDEGELVIVSRGHLVVCES